ncbi:MAG: flagellar filament capping protein FliD [Colwellia sp.]|uniref:flagellar filament capping protein FliD n=1 Tax=Colwellia sp. TaxID=56799 RepID=UPI001DE53E4B|nr:flagellar filament capping protein FliD [Colwellia sp.]NQY48161.1 flagellar filament capping protein FliD [Colwellia sp.]
MASISFTGIGSGLQVSDIVEAIVNAEKIPYESRLARQQGAFTTDISAVGALKSALEAVTASFEGLGDVDQYQQRTATGRDDFIGLSSDKEAEIGKYSIEVEALASAHKLMSGAITDTEAVGEGTLTIESGSNNFNVSVSATATLSEIRDAINDSGDNKSVSATIITDASGQHLVLNSKETGVANAIKVTVDDISDGNNADNLGLSRLAFDATNKLTSANGFSSSDTVGSGTLTFNSDDNDFTVTIDAADTLSDIMETINSNSNNNSVRASIVNDGTSDYLVFSSIEPGAAHAITVTAADDDTNNVDGLGISQFTTTNMIASANVENMAETGTATDAKITIDGTITATSSTNEFKGVIDGIDITAKKIHGVDDDISKISITEDNKNVASGINTFIESFNALVDLSNQLGQVGEGGTGVLAGDSMLRGVMSKIRGQFNKAFDSGNGNTLTLSQLGVRTERDGKLSFEQETLDDLIEQDPDAVQTFLLGADGDNGFVNDMSTFIGFYTDKDGVIQQRIDGKNTQIDKLSSDLEAFQFKMNSLEARLFAQYNAMDLMVAQMNNTSSYLMAQLDNMPGVVRKSK